MTVELEEHHRRRIAELLRQTQRHPDEEPSQATMLEAYKLVLLKDLVHFLDHIETAILNR